MSSCTNAWESENAMRDVLRSARHVLAMDAFANISTLTFLQIYHGENIHVVNNKYQPRIGETVEFIYDPNSGAEAMRIGYDLLRQGKRVAFVSTGVVMARALIEKASKLSKPDNSPARARAYYGDIDGKQRQKDFSNINIAWGELDCVAYTNTVEAGISFEITGHFDVVIAITNIATPVHVEAFAQMLYRIRDCPRHIVSIFYQKNSNELFRSPGRENIRAELESARPNNLPTAIKGHREWDNNTISYKIDESPAVITFIEVEHQKRLSARYFIEKLCSLIASTGASLQLIKMDESREVIGNRKRIRNEVRVEALVIKETDFNAVATSRNLDPEEAEILKFDQERSIADTMALKRFYMRNLYGGKDVNIDDWNNLCNKKFVECFSPPEPRKHFLRLSQFRKHGYDEESAMEGLKAKNIAQWEDTYYKAGENVEKSVAEDLHKLYSANHWKAIRELFQILGFTGIDDIRTLSGNIISEAFTQSCERFIEIRSQSLLLFGFKSLTGDLILNTCSTSPIDGAGVVFPTSLFRLRFEELILRILLNSSSGLSQKCVQNSSKYCAPVRLLRALRFPAI
ncbi:23256_t:CDS:1 [Gigaspora rosea]|nr:23256_t:CDS:1 [Gigaspora rosea]